MRIVSVAYKFSTAAQDILRQSLNLLERIRFFEDSSARSDIFRLTRSMRFRISICFPGLGPAHLLKAFSALVALSCMPVETHVYGIQRSSCVFFSEGERREAFSSWRAGSVRRERRGSRLLDIEPHVLLAHF